MSLEKDVTTVLRNLKEGSPGAAAQLLEIIYHELRRLAQGEMRGQRKGHTLEPTALVHEAYIRLLGGVNPGFENRAHFFAAAARAMRSILVDHARARQAQKRGGARKRVALGTAIEASGGAQDPGEGAIEVIQVHEALEKLEAVDGRKCRIIELMFFAGLGTEEVAEVLGVSQTTVKREWRYAKAWLFKEIGGA